MFSFREKEGMREKKRGRKIEVRRILYIILYYTGGRGEREKGEGKRDERERGERERKRKERVLLHLLCFLFSPPLPFSLLSLLSLFPLLFLFSPLLSSLLYFKIAQYSCNKE
jgi:hypothetical protein